MNFKKVLSGLLITLAVSGLAFGQQLKLKKNGHTAQVARGKKLLYKITVNGKPNMKGRKYDEAFLAGPPTFFWLCKSFYLINLKQSDGQDDGNIFKRF